MENSNTIQIELESLSPLIAALDKGNLYALPEGYFGELPGNLLRLARVAYLNNTKNNQADQSVPEGYFDQLAGNILNKIKVQSSDNNIINTPEIADYLFVLKNKITYGVPAGYFEGLTNNIVSRIEELSDGAVRETNAISSLVGGIKRKAPYSVPNRYFDNLSNQVQAKILPSAKVVSISKFRNFFKYAVAAIFIGAISFTVIKYSAPEKNGYTAKLDKSIQTGIKMDDKKFDETLNTLSQDDILQYLEKNSSDEDVAALTFDLEDKTLPAEEDYLTDDKTLDKFIEAINTKN